MGPCRGGFCASPHATARCWALGAVGPENPREPSKIEESFLSRSAHASYGVARERAQITIDL
jgi:hypothetical protein